MIVCVAFAGYRQNRQRLEGDSPALSTRESKRFCRSLDISQGWRGVKYPGYLILGMAQSVRAPIFLELLPVLLLKTERELSKGKQLGTDAGGGGEWAVTRHEAAGLF